MTISPVACKQALHLGKSHVTGAARLGVGKAAAHFTHQKWIACSQAITPDSPTLSWLLRVLLKGIELTFPAALAGCMFTKQPKQVNYMVLSRYIISLLRLLAGEVNLYIVQPAFDVASLKYSLLCCHFIKKSYTFFSSYVCSLCIFWQ